MVLLSCCCYDQFYDSVHDHIHDSIVKLPLISQLNSTQLNSAKIISEMSEEIVPIFALYHHHHHHQYSFSTLKVLTSPKLQVNYIVGGGVARF